MINYPALSLTLKHEEGELPVDSYEEGGCENGARAARSSVLARGQVWRITVCLGTGANRQERESRPRRHQSPDKCYSGEPQEDLGSCRVQYGLRPSNDSIPEGSSGVFRNERSLLQLLPRSQARADDHPSW